MSMQVWFPGAHSDVGGGYKRRELQDITLFWMAVREASLHGVYSHLLARRERSNLSLP